MGMYEMKPEYYTGIKFVDEEHKKLFDIANTVYDLLIDDFIPDKYDYIMEVVNELKEYAQYHFTHEEQYMNEIRYRKFLSHKVEHDEFIEKINELCIMRSRESLWAPDFLTN